MQTNAAVKSDGRSRVRRGVGRRLRNIAEKRRRLERLRSDREEQMEKVRRAHRRGIQNCRSAMARLERDLEEFCRRNRSLLLDGEGKSLRTEDGRVGYRTAGPKVALADDFGREQACRLLREHGFDRMVRVRRDLDRRAIKKALKGGQLDRGKLARCGVQVRGPREVFYFRIHRNGAD